MSLTDNEVSIRVKGWKQIPGYSKYYISKNGEIQSLCRHRKSVKGAISTKGYHKCSLLGDNGKYKNMFIHRFIAIAYIPNPHNYPIINHKNGNKRDNRLENLEWCTIYQNNKHAQETGLLVKGVTHPNRKLVLNTETGIFYESATEAWETIPHIKKKTFEVMMTGKNPNRTSFIYA